MPPHAPRIASLWGWPALVFAASVLLACQERPLAEQVSAPASEALTTAKAPQPPIAVTATPGGLSCAALRPLATPGQPEAMDTIRLTPPKAEQRLVLSKTGVVVTFSREDCLVAARCLNLKQAIEHLEQQTGQAPEMPLFDAFQLSYVAAALLDLGRASVRLEEETQPRTTIVRGPWSAEGCRGRCISTGRIYRLTEADSSFFLRVTDKTDNSWERGSK
jgi:hypothetical protein